MSVNYRKPALCTCQVNYPDINAAIFSSCPLQKGTVTFEKGIFSQHLSSVCKKLIMNYPCTDSVSWFAIPLNFMQLWQVHLSCTFQSHLHSSLVPPLSKNCPKRQPMLRVSGQTHKSHFNSVVLQSRSTAIYTHHLHLQLNLKVGLE